MNFPSSYDTEALEWEEAQDLVVLTIAGTQGIADTDTQVTFNEAAEVANLNTPTYLTFATEDTAGNFEIVKVTATATGGVCDIDRAELGTTALDHPAGATAVQDPVSQHFASLRTLLLGIEKYHGLVGVEANLPTGCSPGECYIATDTQKVFYAVDTNTWREINELDHATLTGRGDDDHPHYHTDARKDEWHQGLTGYTNVPDGEHITKVAHIHDGNAGEGLPVARIVHGVEANRPTGPSADGQLYYATDTGDLWIGNSSVWVKYSVMPEATIILFEEACPQGWTEFASFQGKFPRGAPTGVYTGFSDGGAATHSHAMPDVITHTHTIQAVADQELAAAGNHNHTFQRRVSSGGVSTLPFNINTGSGIDTMYAGHNDHTHSTTFPEHNTDNDGSNPANTDSASSLPPYVKLVFCEKD
jgi:hypothetical protein